MTDPISNMLAQIKNAQAVNKKTVVIPYSTFKFNLGKVLAKNDYLKKVNKENDFRLKLTLKQNAFEKIKRISKPGQRLYTKAKEIKPVKEGYGKIIISTPQGLMTGQQAKSKNLGGEPICKIW